jgi:hypothetical protein
MAIVGHVGGNEHVLRESLLREVVIEAGEILDLTVPGGVLGDGVEEN